MAVTGAQIVAEAEKLGAEAIGYELGGTGPQYYDCSGLVQAVLTSLGVPGVPRTSEEQYAWANPVSGADLVPGDLVFAQFPGDGTTPGHVGIYVGGGEVYSAQDPAAGIGLASLASWKGNIVGYGSYPGMPAGGNTSGTTAAAAGGTTTASAGSSGVKGSDITEPSFLAGADTLLTDVATVLDYAFGMFGRGQGWRLVFTLVAIATTYLAYRSFAGPGKAP